MLRYYVVTFIFDDDHETTPQYDIDALKNGSLAVADLAGTADKIEYNVFDEHED